MSPRPHTWTYKENKMYILFLRENRKEFEVQKKRRHLKIFLEMSLNIPGKTPEQCRTHHEKSLKKYQRIDKIISCLLPDMEKKLFKILDTQTEPQLYKEE